MSYSNDYLYNSLYTLTGASVTRCLTRINERDAFEFLWRNPKNLEEWRYTHYISEEEKRIINTRSSLDQYQRWFQSSVDKNKLDIYSKILIIFEYWLIERNYKK